MKIHFQIWKIQLISLYKINVTFQKFVFYWNKTILTNQTWSMCHSSTNPSYLSLKARKIRQWQETSDKRNRRMMLFVIFTWTKEKICSVVKKKRRFYEVGNITNYHILQMSITSESFDFMSYNGISYTTFSNSNYFSYAWKKIYRWEGQKLSVNSRNIKFILSMKVNLVIGRTFFSSL